MSELDALNGLCTDLYESLDPTVRAQAEQNLSELSDSPECLRRCMLLLEQGNLPYAPLVASNTLQKLLNSKTSIPVDQKMELSRYVLTMLGSRAPSFPPFVVASLCQLFVRITKQEWLYNSKAPEQTEYPFREPIQAIIKTVDINNVPESLLAVQILSLLTDDMNSMVGMESVSNHRKSMAHFRDEYLLDIFQLTTNFLQNHTTDVQSHTLPLVEAVLGLCLNCLLFDFIGSMADETSEENYNVQVPTLWRTCFIDGNLVRMMFGLYEKLPQSSTEKVLHIIVQLASIRRTLFTGVERQVYLEQLVIGVKMVIENPTKLGAERGAFHEFSRLVARLKTNYQLLELIKIAEYGQMMRLLAEFTVQSLRMMEFSANSTYFLLTFWQRMVTSVPYVRTNDEHLLNVYCPEIIAAFVESRLQNVAHVIVDGADDPLDDQGSTLQIMEHVAVICRCEYESTFRLLSRLFDENAHTLQNSPASDVNYKIAQGRLIWLVTLIGTAVFGKTTVTSNEEHDRLDGDLVARCLKFMRMNDQSLVFPESINSDPANGNLRLEVAFIHLLEQFRRAYIMDQVSRISAVYDKLTTEVGVTDEVEMLSIIIQKILTNLKFWALNDSILSLSLALFKDLSLGYSAVRKLFKLPEIQLLLNNHTSEHFAFLGPSVDFATMKHRTVFYEALTRLLVIDLNDEDEMFLQFMTPLTGTVKKICDVFNGSEAVAEDELKRVIVGVLRDLRGIAVACTTKTVFLMLFDWMYPNMFNIMLRCVETWPDCPEITTPVFRLLSELSQNRQQRLKFEMNSCSAVLLFKEMAKILVAFGDRHLELPDVPKADIYKLRYKSVGILFQCLKSALVGQYVPFGVFRLYGDTCLRDVLHMFVKLYQKIPDEDFHAYLKISQAFYHLLENVVHDHMPFMSNLEPDAFHGIMRSIQSGVNALDATVATAACSALDGVLNYIYKRLSRNGGPAYLNVGSDVEGEGCLISMKNNPQVISELLTSMMSSLMFSDVKCQWSMSRPLLGLILLQEGATAVPERGSRIDVVSALFNNCNLRSNEEVFSNFKDDIMRRAPAGRASDYDRLFNNLMENVERHLAVKNKDTFTQNLAKFRRDLADVLKGNTVAPNTNSEMA